MAATSNIGYGAKFSVESAAPGTFTDVGEVTSIKPPGVSAEVIDRTTMQSPNKTKQKLGGMREWGQAVINFNFDPGDVAVAAGHVTLKSYIGESKKYQITFPDGEKWVFEAIGSNFEIGEITPSGIMTGSFTCDVDGEPTFTPAAP